MIRAPAVVLLVAAAAARADGAPACIERCQFDASVGATVCGEPCTAPALRPPTFGLAAPGAPADLRGDGRRACLTQQGSMTKWKGLVCLKAADPPPFVFLAIPKTSTRHTVETLKNLSRAQWPGSSRSCPGLFHLRAGGAPRDGRLPLKPCPDAACGTSAADALRTSQWASLFARPFATISILREPVERALSEWSFPMATRQELEGLRRPRPTEILEAAARFLLDNATLNWQLAFLAGKRSVFPLPTKDGGETPCEAREPRATRADLGDVKRRAENSSLVLAAISPSSRGALFARVAAHHGWVYDPVALDLAPRAQITGAPAALKIGDANAAAVRPWELPRGVLDEAKRRHALDAELLAFAETFVPPCDPAPLCTDDAAWVATRRPKSDDGKTKTRLRTCAWVAQKAAVRCATTGDDGRDGRAACRASCDVCHLAARG